jgi:leucyl/phenylalanyl-tRNA---protein transferase
VRLHKAGHAQSFEVWKDGDLAGGLYGVRIGRYFSAESMFRRTDNASKLALFKAVEHLRSLGLAWLDIQVMTPHMRRHGARVIPRAEFLARLKQALR